ncbi:MAG TPA: hypothetical protein DIC34_01040 [Treponema sp.]|nr:MAG: hypothetical protein A2Y36_00515 [Treponema sp. GWA1_62_8]OHE64514.1 MAG: hypothetical protein A2001_03125 [Treponema sp. GWC1_61_84]HCM25129.1 hypothetical protein [Treponema sp.]
MNTLVKAEIWTVARTEQGNAVLIRPLGADIAVPIFVGQLETQSILIGFGDVTMPRPLTHDLMLSLIKRLDADLLRVEINDLRDGTFFARLVIEWNGSEFVVDSRPSDALALAVRRKCPVYIAESVVDAAGVAVNLIVDESIAASREEGETGERANADSENERVALTAELERAIAAEEYEKAAKIRDLLAALNSKEGSGDKRQDEK